MTITVIASFPSFDSRARRLELQLQLANYHVAVALAAGLAALRWPPLARGASVRFSSIRAAQFECPWAGELAWRALVYAERDDLLAFDWRRR